MRVQWTEESLDRAADLYITLDLAGQDEFAAAVARINARLASDPWAVGESRSTRNHRSWYSPPVTVLFEVFPDDEIVLIQHVAAKRPK